MLGRILSENWIWEGEQVELLEKVYLGLLEPFYQIGNYGNLLSFYNCAASLLKAILRGSCWENFTSYKYNILYSYL